MTDSKDLIKFKKGKKIKLETTHCKKCGKELDLRITTELDKKEEKKGVKPQVLIIYGICEACKIVYVLNLVQTKDIPCIEKK